MSRKLVIASVCCLLSGCYNLPSIRHPGTATYQQNRASMHDPYADNDIGPEIVGSRPREFQKPLAEPVRNTLFGSSWWTRSK